MKISVTRQAIKLTSLWICNCLAVLFSLRSKPAILMYHSFDTKGWRHGVDPKELKRQLQYLIDTRTVVPLSEVVAWVQGRQELPNNAVAITIDDGYEDTYSIFFPLAKEYQLPFTLFLTTDLSPMAKLGNLPRPTIDQLKEMQATGLMTLGVHGHSHTNFPEVLKVGKEKDEIADSRAFLESTFGGQADFIAYPAGRVNDAVFAYVKAAGYAGGCTTRQGFLKQGDDPLRLKRVPVDRNTSFALFRERLKAGYPWYLKLVSYLK